MTQKDTLYKPNIDQKVTQSKLNINQKDKQYKPNTNQKVTQSKLNINQKVNNNTKQMTYIF